MKNLESSITEYLRRENLSEDLQPENELTLDSYSTTLLLVHLEREFGVRFYSDDLVPEHFRNVRTIARLVLGKLAKGSPVS